VLNLESLELKFLWKPVLQDDGGPYRFPSPLAQRKAGPYAGPAVYRWLPFRETPGDMRRVYIGEADNLARRVYHYLNPELTQQTNTRMRALMDGLLQEGLHIQLDALSIDGLRVNGADATHDALLDREMRRLVENWMIVVHRRAGYEVLNA
jgi:hypothetical protein